MSHCRHCHSTNLFPVLDLGFAPPSNAYLAKEQLNQGELTLPLRINVCEQCWLVQTQDFTVPEKLFVADYAYFSSTSSSWLNHAAHYCEMITNRFKLNRDSYVVEIAANDGYLLQNFVTAQIPCLGIEPTADTAAVARAKNIPIIQAFFNANMAQEMVNKGQQADLIVANNVFAHVPDINDFSQGLHTLLKANGVITLEFPHLLSLIKQVQFDTIYHEHFSYFSLYTVKQILAKAGLRIFAVETLNTHGGSLRVYACHLNALHRTSTKVEQLIDQEAANRLFQRDGYQDFQSKVDKIKNDLVRFLIEKKEEGKTVVAYGAAAKGNTLLNYAGVKPDLLPVVFDAAKSKQGKYLPGSHIPILPPNHIEQYEPTAVLILPWNIANEIMTQLNDLKVTSFYTAVPKLERI